MKLPTTEPYRIGWFSTGRDEAAIQLLESVYERRGKLGIEIAYVFTNRSLGEDPQSDKFIHRAYQCGGSWLGFSSSNFEPDLRRFDRARWREEYHAEVMRRLADIRAKANPQIDILAGYMLYTSSQMAKQYKLLNLHPALPWGPAGAWEEVIWELMKTYPEETGVMMHRATKEWDRGPPVTYCRVPLKTEDFLPLWEEFGQDLRHYSAFEQLERLYPATNYPHDAHPLFRKIREEGFRREIPLILYTIDQFAKGTVRFEGEAVVDKHGKILDHGLDVTALVEKELRTRTKA